MTPSVKPVGQTVWRSHPAMVSVKGLGQTVGKKSFGTTVKKGCLDAIEEAVRSGRLEKPSGDTIGEAVRRGRFGETVSAMPSPTFLKKRSKSAYLLHHSLCEILDLKLKSALLQQWLPN
jgi:hypothetical protein